MRFVLGLWLVFITLLSLSPYHFKIWLGTTGHLHEGGHVAAFVLTTLLIFRAARTTRAKVLGCVAIFGFALCLEALERFVYHSLFEWKDIALDTTGIAAGGIVLLLAEWLAAPRRGRAEVPPEA